MKRVSIVPVIFLVLSIIAWYFSEMSITFVLNEVTTRFIRNGLIVLALLVPIAAGMGLNFAITIGALSAQIGFLIAIDRQVTGMPGLLLVVVLAVFIATVLGYLIGVCLNRVKGKEMITTIIIGFLGTSIYQLIFMVGYGTFITPHNTEIMLSRGIGIRDMVDLVAYRNIIEKIWLLQIGSIKIPLLMVLIILCFCLLIRYLMGSKLGQQFKAVGQDIENAEMLGINVNKVRIQAIIISTVIACLGQIIYIQNIGMLNVYTGHLNSDIFACAALLAGGATIRQARVRHVLLGIFLFHSLFIVSPQAGQNIFGNAALGEYFRSFVAYGTIAIALVLNIKNENYAKRNQLMGIYGNRSQLKIPPQGKPG